MPLSASALCEMGLMLTYLFQRGLQINIKKAANLLAAVFTSRGPGLSPVSQVPEGFPQGDSCGFLCRALPPPCHHSLPSSQ